jgi:Fe-S-cluster-containing dehydrogenase component
VVTLPRFCLLNLKEEQGMPVTTAEKFVPFIVSGAPVGAPEDPLVTMQADLKRAMKKPLEQRRWIMAIDLRKCVGCSACTIACVAENKLPPGVVYRPVMDEEIGKYPNVTRRFLPRPCMQCDEPPCVPVCPVSATYQRADGIVEVDYKACIGCRYCITACPYNARSFDFGESYVKRTPVANAASIVGPAKAIVYEKSASFEYGKQWARAKGESPVDNVRKCTFCAHRLDAGMLPACTTTCIGRATYFGDANDPDSLVSKLIGSPNMMRLREDMGTAPKVYYLT